MNRPLAGGPRLPAIDADSRPFWESCRRHAMAIQRCTACGTFRFPPSRVCPRCHSGSAAWVPVSGKGRVYASLVVCEPLDRASTRDVPFNLSLIELDEGIRLWSNVVECDPDDVRIGDRVRVTYEDATPEATLPRFLRVPSP